MYCLSVCNPAFGCQTSINLYCLFWPDRNWRLLLTTSLRTVNITSLTRCESLDIYSRPICCCCCCCYYLVGCVFNKLIMYHHRQCRFLCIRFITSKYCNKRAIVMFEINAYWLIDCDQCMKYVKHSFVLVELFRYGYWGVTTWVRWNSLIDWLIDWLTLVDYWLRDINSLIHYAVCIVGHYQLTSSSHRISNIH